MNEEEAIKIIEPAGFKIASIRFIPEGTSHDIFDLVLDTGEAVIARIEKKKSHTIEGQRRDFHYNGLISLEREAYLCTLVREQAELPSPKIKGLYESGGNRFLLVEKMPGKLWKDFLKDQNYSLQAYLISLEHLGNDLARAQRLQFPSYGDVTPKGIEPTGLSLVERLQQVLDLKLQREEKTGALNPAHLEEVKAYFRASLNQVAEPLRSAEISPVLILADFHPSNFLVDEKGKPSGYFDLEFCQAGHPVQEFYFLGLQLFSYFDEPTRQQAREAFFRSFQQSGGKYGQNTAVNYQLENLLCAGQILTAVTAYHGAKDGLRDTWSSEFKEILFSLIATDKVDYVQYADIIRQKTKQPLHPEI